MNRILTVINFLGILAVAGLCASQWKQNSDMAHQNDLLDHQRQAQAATIDDQQKTLKQDDDDLSDVRNRLAASDSALTDARDKLTAATAKGDALATENAQLKTALDQWHSAVAARDNQLKQYAAQIQQTMADRNDAVKRFNDLATKYNAMVKSASSAGQ